MRRGWLAVFALGLVLAIAASYLWNRWLEHDIDHDSAPTREQPK